MRSSANPDKLRGSDFAQIAWDAIEPIWDDLPFSHYRRLVSFMEELSLGQRSLISVDWCQKEIRNGGIAQLFCNPTGNLVPWALVGFRVIGAEAFADVLEKAVSMLGPEYPTSGSARRKAYVKATPQQKQEIEQLEDRFFALLRDPAVDFERRRGSYVLEHPHQFTRGALDG